MKRAIIFANGQMEALPTDINVTRPGDVIIAADGGTLHCKILDIVPDIIIGDFDSLVAEEITTFRAAGVELIRYPTHKDETDLELALQLARDRDLTQVVILGAMGARWDMTIANLLLAAQDKFSTMDIRLLDGSQELSILRGEAKLDIEGRQGDSLSLIPILGDAIGVTTHGLEYSLKNERLYFGSPRGVSNIILAAYAQVSIREGILLVCLLKGQND
jgi:thiamine pyrophosphokinase